MLLGGIAAAETATWRLSRREGDPPWLVSSTFATGEPRDAGDYGFDPLGLSPRRPAEREAMQAREIASGRGAMLGLAGMVGQELLSGGKVLGEIS